MDEIWVCTVCGAFRGECEHKGRENGTWADSAKTERIRDKVASRFNQGKERITVKLPPWATDEQKAAFEKWKCEDRPKDIACVLSLLKKEFG